MNRRGQFYLLAAVVIIAAIIGFAAVSNYANRGTAVKVYDLKEELGFESEQVLEYGVLSDNVENVTIHFTTLYTDYVGDDKDLYFIYGDAGDVRVISYLEEVVGGTSINIGTAEPYLEIVGRVEDTIEADANGGKVKFTIGETEYEFDLEDGENFYFIISQDLEGETHVATG